MKLILVVLWLLLLINIILWMTVARGLDYHVWVVIGWLAVYPVSPFLLPPEDKWRS